MVSNYYLFCFVRTVLLQFHNVIFILLVEYITEFCISKLNQINATVSNCFLLCFYQLLFRSSLSYVNVMLCYNTVGTCDFGTYRIGEQRWLR